MSELRQASAFVVQFEAGTDFDAGLVKGRAEHVSSGQTSRFESADELVGVFARMLKDAQRGGSVRSAEGEMSWLVE